MIPADWGIVDVSSFGFGTIGILAVLGVLTGRLVPRSQVVREVGRLERSEARWQQAAEERSAQLQRLLVALDPQTKALEYLTRVAREGEGVTDP